MLDAINQLAITDEERAGIFALNAARLLGLSLGE